VHINGKEVINYDIEVDYFGGYDDYEAYFCYAEYSDGTILSDDDLEILQDNYGDVIYEYVSDKYVPALGDFL
jgi:hypothetical protein